MPKRGCDVTDVEEFVRARNLALMELDMSYARKMLPDAANDEVRLMAMHKARYECTGIADIFRNSSKQWLVERGLKRFDGSDFTEELPK